MLPEACAHTVAVKPRRRAIGASTANAARCTGHGGLTALISSANLGPTTARVSNEGIPRSSSLPCSASSNSVLKKSAVRSAGRNAWRGPTRHQSTRARCHRGDQPVAHPGEACRRQSRLLAPDQARRWIRRPLRQRTRSRHQTRPRLRRGPTRCATPDAPPRGLASCFRAPQRSVALPPVARARTGPGPVASASTARRICSSAG
jgi:hypothetical protein